MTSWVSSRTSRAALPAGPRPPRFGMRKPTLIVSGVTPWSDATSSTGSADGDAVPVEPDGPAAAREPDDVARAVGVLPVAVDGAAPPVDGAPGVVAPPVPVGS